jgi:hypothetical protein
MNAAVYRVPPSPSREKGASDPRLFREHRGSSTSDDSSRITLDRLLTAGGREKV